MQKKDFENLLIMSDTFDGWQAKEIIDELLEDGIILLCYDRTSDSIIKSFKINPKRYEEIVKKRFRKRYRIK
jgi:hypothetical protein